MPQDAPVARQESVLAGGVYDAESLGTGEQAPYLSHARDLRVTEDPLQPPTSSQLNAGAEDSYQKAGYTF